MNPSSLHFSFQKLLLCAEYVFIAVFAPCLLIFGIIPIRNNLEVLVSVFLLVVVISAIRIVIVKRWKLTDVFPNNKQVDAFFTSYIGTIAAFLVAMFFFTTGSLTFLQHTVMGSILQVFLYQGYLLRLGKEIFRSSALNYGVNTVVFTGMHSFYPLDAVSIVLIFLSGIFFNFLYWKFRDFTLVSIVHVILNGSAIFFLETFHY